MSTNLTNLKGGEFLVNSMNFADIYTPEDLTEDQILFKSAIEDFVKNRILPNIQKIDKQEPGLTPKLMEEAGELGGEHGGRFCGLVPGHATERKGAGEAGPHPSGVEG